MNSPSKIPFKVRFAVFLILWLTAGLIFATFSDFGVEAGDSMLAARAEMVCLAPLVAAQGLAFVLAPSGYNVWPRRQEWEEITELTLLCVFTVHAIMMLTRQAQRQFVVCVFVQVGLLLASIAAVLYYFHWDALHMHG